MELHSKEAPFLPAHPVCMGLATGLTLSEVSVAGLLGISESSSYSLGNGSGVCCYKRGGDDQHSENNRESQKPNIKYNICIV